MLIIFSLISMTNASIFHLKFSNIIAIIILNNLRSSVISFLLWIDSKVEGLLCSLRKGGFALKNIWVGLLFWRSWGLENLASCESCGRVKIYFGRIITFLWFLETLDLFKSTCDPFYMRSISDCTTREYKLFNRSFLYK